MVTAGLGARAAHALNASTLQKCLGVFMLLVAPTVPFKDDILETVRQRRDERRNRNSTRPAVDSSDEVVVTTVVKPHQAQLSFPGFFDSCVAHAKNGVAVVGLGSGFLAGLFGVGGGQCISLNTCELHSGSLIRF